MADTHDARLSSSRLRTRCVSGRRGEGGPHFVLADLSAADRSAGRYGRRSRQGIRLEVRPDWRLKLSAGKAVRILITGGAGFIGSTVVAHCIRLGDHTVLNL